MGKSICCDTQYVKKIETSSEYKKLLTYKLQIFFPDLVKHHLTDVVTV